MEWYLGVGFGCLVAGAIIGGLIVRNNYKRFFKTETEVRDFILDSKLTAEQKILRIRQRFGV